MVPQIQACEKGCKYRGVRMRSWGKWVCEIRLPNSRERVWLGSYATAEEAARAYDAALVSLRGQSSALNFPQHPPPIASRCLTARCLRATAAFAASFAHSSSSSSSSSATNPNTDPPAAAPPSRRSIRNHTQQCQCIPDTLSCSHGPIMIPSGELQQEMPQFYDLQELCWVGDDLQQHGLVATSTAFTSLYSFDVGKNDHPSKELPSLWQS